MAPQRPPPTRMLLFEEFQAKGGKLKAKDGRLGPKRQGTKAPRRKVSDLRGLGSLHHHRGLEVVGRRKKHGWCAPIRRHSSRSDVSRLGCTIRASPQRQRNQASDDCCNAHICAYRPLSASKAACDPRSTMCPASSTKISWASTTVDKRCAITKVVLLCAALCNSP